MKNQYNKIYINTPNNIIKYNQIWLILSTSTSQIDKFKTELIKGRYRQATLDLVEVYIPGLFHFHLVSFFERQIIFVDGIKVI